MSKNRKSLLSFFGKNRRYRKSTSQRATRLGRFERLEDRRMLSANTLWTEQLGTSNDDVSQSVSADGLGNVYISGYTSGTLEGTNAGLKDAFVSKYNSSGALLWSEQLGTSSNEKSWDVSADGLGNVYISGETGGDLQGTNAGGSDAFVSKYNSSGTLLWTKQLGTSSFDYSYGVSADGLGNVYISGETDGDLEGSNAGSTDAFVSKYNASGTLLWTKQLGTGSAERSWDVSADGLGNVYISGFTQGNLDGTSAGGFDAFVSKYNSGGTLLWTEQLGTSSTDVSLGVSADGLGNVYISGITQGSLNGTNAGLNDTFVSKYNSNGTLLWTKQLGTSSSDYSWDVSADGLGSVYISGYTSGSLEGTNAGGLDAFVSKYNSSGTLLWVEQFGTNTSDASYGVSADGLGGVYISGETYGDLDGTNAGGADAFVVRITDNPFLVNTTSDTVDANLGDGIAEDSSGNTSLRAAIQEANALGVPTKITLPEGHYELDLTGAELNNASSNDLDITGDITIVGAGAGLSVIDAGGQTGLGDRIFEVRPTASLELSDVTVTGGYTGTYADPNTSSGGGILLSGGASAVVSRSAFVDNHANGSNIRGGAIFNSNSTLSIVDSVFTENSAEASSGAIHAGGVNSALTVQSSVFAKNSSPFASNVFVTSGTHQSLGNNRLDNNDGATSLFVNGVNGDSINATPDYVVTSVADTFDHSDDVFSLSSREAIDNANGMSGQQEIWLPAWDYNLILTGTELNNASSNDLDITGDITIVGAGAGLSVIDAGGQSGLGDRIFEVRPTASLELSDVTVTGGYTGTYVDPNTSSGGGILLSGGASAVVSRSALVDNHANGFNIRGGAIFNSNSTLSVIDSVFTENSAEASSGAIHAGGVNSAFTVQTSVFAKNSSPFASNVFVTSGTHQSLGNNRLDNNDGATSLFVNGVNGDSIDVTPDYVVTSVADRIDVNDGGFSLREAVIDANVNVGIAEEIWLPAWTFLLTIDGTDTGTPDASIGDLDITDDLTIRGISSTDTLVDATAILDAAFEEIGSATLTKINFGEI